MKTTAEKLNRAPAEAFRVASQGDMVTIAHGQYPGFRFELTARPVKSTNTIGPYDMAAVRNFDDIDKAQILEWIRSNCSDTPNTSAKIIEVCVSGGGVTGR